MTKIKRTDKLFTPAVKSRGIIFTYLQKVYDLPHKINTYIGYTIKCCNLIRERTNNIC